MRWFGYLSSGGGILGFLYLLYDITESGFLGPLSPFIILFIVICCIIVVIDIITGGKVTREIKKSSKK